MEKQKQYEQKEQKHDDQYQEEQEQKRQMMKNKMNASKQELEQRLKQYLDSVPSVKDNGRSKEFEIRFGKFAPNGRNISKIDYDNVVKQILAEGFVSKNKDGLQILRIYSEFQDMKTGQTKHSQNIRAEINGTDLISEYCATNSLEKVLQLPSTKTNKLKFTQKTSTLDRNGRYQNPIDFPDMGFRVDFKYEQDFGITSAIAQRIMEKWSDNKKKFRFLNRVQFEHPDYPILVDISIVKESMRIPNYTIQESHLFDSPPKYEIELELDNMRVGPGPGKYEELMDKIRKMIRIIMSGIQGTSYPISLTEREDVLQGYLRLIHGEEEYRERYVSSNDFIGPSSYTLQMQNIVEDRANSKSPNIRENYTVTDKADGDRKMLYVDHRGYIYLLDTNMNVQFTGSKTNAEICFHSLLDGEHIKYNKFGDSIHLYKSFDIYFIHSETVMQHPLFAQQSTAALNGVDETEKPPSQQNPLPPISRIQLLQEFIEKLRPQSILKENNQIWRQQTKKNGEIFWFELKSGKIQKEAPPQRKPVCRLRVESKEFFCTGESTTIFECCSKIISNVKDSVYEYNTDGLIFTPAYSSVGSVAAGIPGLLHKYTWEQSFKWKPAEFNTIDFLVEVYKENGKDKIQHIFEEGANTMELKPIVEYKTLVLRCGVDTKKHMLENAFNDIIHERLPSPGDIDNESTYESRPFEPTDPYDPHAWMCNIVVKNMGDDQRSWVMTTETGEYFEENMIVEFRYDVTAQSGWNWKPIRVRYDKTQKLLQGQREFGNAYHVANSNWYSIHHPITENMITTGENIEQTLGDDTDVYYTGALEDSRTAAMRNFHNLYVKKKLIMGVANPDATLIDYAVGKGGDLPKWRQAKLAMVLGIDISRDNISGATDNACVRYLKECGKYDRVPYCLFLRGDSSQNIRGLEAFPGDKTSKERMIASAIFGKGPKDATLLGKGVYNRYGIAESGFSISSCQFAVHYFFENIRKLHDFVRNVAECTRVQGYFITTGYDGNAVFRLLRHKKEGEGVAFFAKDKFGKQKKICEIIRKYGEDGFEDDETSVGYRIHVFQETIQKTSVEYLVSFGYLVRIMENYGFELVTDEEAGQMGLPHASGMFEGLFQSMKTEIEKDPKKRADYKQALFMSDAEKQISFLNRYCVFRKVATVSKETMDQFAKQAAAMYANQPENGVNPELEAAFNRVLDEREASRGNVMKLKMRLVLRPKKENSVVNEPEEDMTKIIDSVGKMEEDERDADTIIPEVKLIEEVKEEVKIELPPQEEQPKPKLVIKGKKRMIIPKK
jgi:hypothetical protein